MRAVRLTRHGGPAELTDVERPEPAGSQVLRDGDAAGVCPSDLAVISAPRDAMAFDPPYTLGHEIAGRVAAAGPDATGAPEPGTPVVVHGPWGCGACDRCREGRDNYCDRRGALGWAGAGLGRDGGMADAVLVPHPRHLVPAPGLDPRQAAPLTDAGLTPFHAIAPHRNRLTEGTTALVVGVGGLGHLAVQILRAVTRARIVAVDVREAALELATRHGADLATRSAADTAAVVRRATDGRGADLVLDFVGSDDTLRLGRDALRADGELTIVGSGGGSLVVRKPFALPPGTRVSLPFWGSAAELAEVVALATAGRISVDVETFPLEQAPEALARLAAGELTGRAVLTPLAGA